jgi:hypothetical protein
MEPEASSPCSVLSLFIEAIIGITYSFNVHFNIMLFLCINFPIGPPFPWIFPTEVGFETLTAVVTKNSISWDITPRSPLKVDRHFGGRCLLCLLPASCLAYSSNLKMDVTCSPETSVNFQRSTRRYIQNIEPFFLQPKFVHILTSPYLLQAPSLSSVITESSVIRMGDQNKLRTFLCTQSYPLGCPDCFYKVM